MTRTFISRWKHALVFLLFVGITLAFTAPLITRMSTHFSGDNIDVWLNMWVNWWTSKVLHQDGLRLYQTTDILYPGGVPLYFHSFSHTNTVPWLLLEPLIGPLAAYNVTVLMGFVLLGFGIYLVVHELTSSVGAGLVAGLAATFAPYHVWECVHPNLFTTQYAALLLWALIKLFRQPTWWRGALAGIFFALSTLSGWHQPIYAAVIISPYVIWSLLAARPDRFRKTCQVLGTRTWGRQLWLALLTSALVAIALAGTAAVPLVREQIRAGYAEPDINWIFNTDLLALVTPSFLHPLWGEAVRPIYDRFPAPNRPAFVGYTVLLLAILGLRTCLRRDQRRVHGWLAVATLLSLVLALGTKLYVNGTVVVPNLLWYEPIIGFIRTPIRLNLVFSQCLAILAGFGVAKLESELDKRKHKPERSPELVRASSAPPQSRRWISLIAALLSALVLFEFLAWPFPTTAAYTPAFYPQLAQEPGTFAIVEAPQDRQTDKVYMYWQTIHGKPLINGHISRPPASAFDFIEGNQITHAFAHREPLRGTANLGIERSNLADAGVRYIVIHKQFLPPELSADWIAALATRPVYEDKYITVFATQPQAGTSFGVLHNFDGLLLSQAWLELGQPLMIETHWVAPAAATVSASLRRAGQEHPALTDASTEIRIEGRGFSAIRTSLSQPDLPPGEYEMLLTANGDSFVLPQRLIVAADGQFLARVQPNATWDETIVLRGIDWHRIANTLTIDLQWEARQTPGTGYKYFVHLLDEDGALIAQFDGVPQDWTYPTSRWTAGETIPDRATLDLNGVPPGAYHLAIGWYAPESGRRLHGIDANGHTLPGDELRIDQVVTVP